MICNQTRLYSLIFRLFPLGFLLLTNYCIHFLQLRKCTLSLKYLIFLSCILFFIIANNYCCLLLFFFPFNESVSLDLLAGCPFLFLIHRIIFLKVICLPYLLSVIVHNKFPFKKNRISSKWKITGTSYIFLFVCSMTTIGSSKSARSTLVQIGKKQRKKSHQNQTTRVQIHNLLISLTLMNRFESDYDFMYSKSI